jgi:hypothetical protein
VACVPTGMKTGVSMVPCGVCSKPARARVCGHSATTSKEIWFKFDCKRGIAFHREKINLAADERR